MADNVVLVAGNVGAGKTELVRFLSKEKSSWTIVPEFVDSQALELFYHNRQEYTEIFERSCLVGRQVRHMKAKHSSGIYVFDRGMIEGAETFCKNSFEEGFLSHQDYHDYISDLKRGMDKLGRPAQNSWLESLIVYLRVEDPRVLQERQVRRGTKGEVIPFNYLQRINEKYGELMNNLPDVYARYGVKAPKLITIDASIDFKRDPFYHSRILEQIVAEIGARSTPRE